MVVHFAKAFALVEHASLWAALQEQGVAGKDGCPAISNNFKIQCGNKRRSNVSAVLENVFKRIQLNWVEKDWGIKVDCKRLTNLKSADVVILVASSKK